MLDKWNTIIGINIIIGISHVIIMTIMATIITTTILVTVMMIGIINQFMKTFNILQMQGILKEVGNHMEIGTNNVPKSH